MRKAPKTRAKKKHPRIKSQNPETQGFQKSDSATIFQSLRDILKSRLSLLIMGLTGITVGIATQINWIQLKCPNEPFQGSGIAICSHNLPRVIFGGPILFVIMLVLITAIRRWSPRLTPVAATVPFLLLLPLNFLPLLSAEQQKNQLTTAVVILLLLALFFLLRDKVTHLLRQVFAKPAFSATVEKTPAVTTITFSGTFTVQEKPWIYDTLQDLLTNETIPGSRVELDIGSLTGYTSDYSFVFHMIAALASYQQISIRLKGEAKQITAINRTLQFAFPAAA